MAIYEPIMTALLAYLKANIAANTFNTFQRGIVMWDELSRVQNNLPVMRQPALFLYDGVGFGGGKTKYEQRGRGTPPVRIMDRTIVIYARMPNPGGLPGGGLGGEAVQNFMTASGAAVLHPLIEAVETAIGTSDTASQGTLTLSGLVSHCWLEGDGMVLSPDIDENGQGMATLPIRIMVP
jgi:hypothetical protein